MLFNSKFTSTFTLFLILFAGCLAQAKPAQELGDLKAALDKIVASSHIPKERLGLVVGLSGDLSDAVYSLNAEKRMIPASLTKIVTAGAVLEKMPVGHQFVTTLNSSSQIKSGVLKGDLYLKGGGDAGFVSESMWFLVNEFVRNDITAVEGNLIVDDSFFDSIRYDAGRDPERVDRAYDAPIGAMTFNWSAVNIYVRPGDGKARVYLDPVNSYLKLVNNTKTVSGNKNTITATRRNNEIVVSGNIGTETPEVVIYKSVTEPDLWAGYNLREFLKQRGIAVSGEVKSGKMPASTKVLASAKSKPVSDQVRDMMKFSNNYVAEILTKNLSAQVTGGQGTMDKGVSILKEYVRSIGITDFDLFSPSGLSRKNALRPGDMFKILSHVKSNFKIFPEYLSSLPILGVDGTLKRRPGDSPVFARVRAKTGHLSGVSGLAGFLGREDEQQMTFVFLYNGTDSESPKSKDLFDRLLIALSKNKGEVTE